MEGLPEEIQEKLDALNRLIEEYKDDQHKDYFAEWLWFQQRGFSPYKTPQMSKYGLKPFAGSERRERSHG